VPETVLDRLESIERELCRHYEDLLRTASPATTYSLAQTITQLRYAILCLR